MDRMLPLCLTEPLRLQRLPGLPRLQCFPPDVGSLRLLPGSGKHLADGPESVSTMTLCTESA